MKATDKQCPLTWAIPKTDDPDTLCIGGMCAWFRGNEEAEENQPNPGRCAVAEFANALTGICNRVTEKTPPGT